MENIKEIIDICEEAMKHEQFDESIHYSYIKALATKGSMGQAKEHFRYMSDTFRREFGISPLRVLKNYTANCLNRTTMVRTQYFHPTA